VQINQNDDSINGGHDSHRLDNPPWRSNYREIVQHRMGISFERALDIVRPIPSIEPSIARHPLVWTRSLEPNDLTFLLHQSIREKGYRGWRPPASPSAFSCLRTWQIFEAQDWEWRFVDSSYRKLSTFPVTSIKSQKNWRHLLRARDLGVISGIILFILEGFAFRQDPLLWPVWQWLSIYFILGWVFFSNIILFQVIETMMISGADYLVVDVFLTLACIHYFFLIVVVIFLDLVLNCSPFIGFGFVLLVLSSKSTSSHWW
jgi:hypothetical protein